ncbi:hypothetical protein [Azospirillum sp. INR13]|uniref:hypothetical protein n=1 Tax=Azospirillum sp. INR13 TaxID=2596919 RepID=UPI00351C1FBA
MRTKELPGGRDDAGGDVGERGVRTDAQQAAQAAVFRLQPQSRLLPLQKPGVLGLQALVLVEGVLKLDHRLDHARRGRGGAGDRVEDRGEGVGHAGAGAVHRYGLDLADHHQRDGGKDKQEEGETLRESPQRRGKADDGAG